MFFEFCWLLNFSCVVLECLFVFEFGVLFLLDDLLRIIEVLGCYKEVEKIGVDIVDLFGLGVDVGEIVVVVCYIEVYGEMLEDVFVCYGIVYIFEIGVLLICILCIKYWFVLLDLVMNECGCELFGCVMLSVYYWLWLLFGIDVEWVFVGMGYIDCNYLCVFVHVVRKSSLLMMELEWFEKLFDDLEGSIDMVFGFMLWIFYLILLMECDC